MQYLLDWSARAQPQGFREKTLHGDMMCLAKIVERAARQSGHQAGSRQRDRPRRQVHRSDPNSR